MKVDELRNRDESALQEELTNLLREQFNLRMQRGSGQLTKTHQLKAVKKNIAKVKTVMREKKGGVS